MTGIVCVHGHSHQRIRLVRLIIRRRGQSARIGHQTGHDVACCCLGHISSEFKRSECALVNLDCLSHEISFHSEISKSTRTLATRRIARPEETCDNRAGGVSASGPIAPEYRALVGDLEVCWRGGVPAVGICNGALHKSGRDDTPDVVSALHGATRGQYGGPSVAEPGHCGYTEASYPVAPATRRIPPSQVLAVMRAASSGI